MCSLAGYKEHDAQEFFISLFTKLNIELNNMEICELFPPRVAAEQAAADQAEMTDISGGFMETSLMTDIFGVTLETRIVRTFHHICTISEYIPQA